MKAIVYLMMNLPLPFIKTTAYTLLALLAFAGNSVLCRMALADKAIDAASFTFIRLLSGAIVLYLLCSFRSEAPRSTGSWRAAAILFVYAALFSFAYLLLDAAVGALVLFGSVQITMILVDIYRGNRLHILEYLGVVMSFTGFVYLMWPSLAYVREGVSLLGFSLMVVAGIAWGGYTLMGKGAADPMSETAFNFAKSLPFVIVLLGMMLFVPVLWSFEGVLLAIISGAITSGLGYALWYAALSGLSSIQASVVQLMVPVITAVGGVMWMEEVVTLPFVVATLMILGGVLLVICTRHTSG